jgi:transcriptional accessory protein Tex/SPT6
MSKTVSLEDEREVINKIKQTCGGITTKNLEGMIADFAQSKEVEDLYLQKCDSITVKY